MTDPAPFPLESWRRLYAAADRIRKLAPWTWMEETDVFGVQFPGSDQVGYVSVMGGNKEHYAVTVYLGSDALNGFWHMENDLSVEQVPERILELPQLMASFEDRELVEKADREIIKQLGLQYRGRNAWPLFRSYRPGFHPWFLEPDEIGKLTLALEQTAGMAMRLEDAPDLLETTEEDQYLVRVPRDTNGGLTWEDAIRPAEPPTPVTLTFRLEQKDIANLRRRAPEDLTIEVDFSLAPILVGKRGERPLCTYVLMAVEQNSGMILGAEFMQAPDGLPRMWERIPAALVAMLNTAPFLPRQIRLASPRLAGFLRPIQQALGLQLVPCDQLPAVEEAKASLWQFLERGHP